MNRILLSNIELYDGEVVSVGSDGRYAHLPQKQGTLDGACATYSVMMALLILGTISEEDMLLGEQYTSKSSKKLFRIFCEDHGMHRNGQTFFKINKMLKEGFASEVITKHRLMFGKDAAYEIAFSIDKDIPVVASIAFKGTDMGHAFLVVGYEEENGVVHKLLCLDPSGVEPKGRKRWNAEISIYRKQKYFDHILYGFEAQKVELQDFITIKRR